MRKMPGQYLYLLTVVSISIGRWQPLVVEFRAGACPWGAGSLQGRHLAWDVHRTKQTILKRREK
jgi:hypothetical protein